MTRGYSQLIKIGKSRAFPGDPVVKNQPANAGDKGFIPGLGTKITCAESLCTRKKTQGSQKFKNYNNKNK